MTPSPAAATPGLSAPLSGFARPGGRPRGVLCGLLCLSFWVSTRRSRGAHPGKAFAARFRQRSFIQTLVQDARRSVCRFRVVPGQKLGTNPRCAVRPSRDSPRSFRDRLLPSGTNWNCRHAQQGKQVLLVSRNLAYARARTVSAHLHAPARILLTLACASNRHNGFTGRCAVNNYQCRQPIFPSRPSTDAIPRARASVPGANVRKDSRRDVLLFAGVLAGSAFLRSDGAPSHSPYPQRSARVSRSPAPQGPAVVNRGREDRMSSQQTPWHGAVRAGA